MTTKKCSRGSDSVLSFTSGFWSEAQHCMSPFVCCDTGLDAEVGCFCKVDTSDSSEEQGENDVHTTGDPNRGRSCFNDRTGIWRCIKGMCAPEQYCTIDGKLCQNTDMGPMCAAGEFALDSLAAGCTDSCPCGCRGLGDARFCPCLEHFAEQFIEDSTENAVGSALENEASVLTKRMISIFSNSGFG